MNIIDAHHHIWRQADLPWLLGPEQPRIFGPYKAIMRDYLIEEFLEDIKGSGIAKSLSMCRPTGRRTGLPTRLHGCKRWRTSPAGRME